MADRPARRQHRWRAIAAISIGNALEWFDLVAFGFFAPTIGKLFFPAADPRSALLFSFGAFGVAFLVRPAGALVLGSYADRAGRKAGLLATISLMMIGTLMIAVMPTYASIGVWAPVGLVVARLIQGFSAGGEFGAATALLVEQDPARRGFYGSWQFASQGLTTAIAAGFGLALNTVLSPTELEDWGWRAPFFFGLLVGPVALYIRRALVEPAEFTSSDRQRRPVRTALAAHKGSILAATGAVILATASSYMLLLMPTYGVRELGMAPASAYASTFLAGLVQLVMTPLAGIAADRLGALRVGMVSAGVISLVALPLYAWLISSSSFAALLVVQCILAVLSAVYLGSLPAIMSGLFPTGVRTTSLSLSYNAAVSVFGGFAPFCVTWLIGLTGSEAMPGAYLAGAAVLSIVALAGSASRAAS